LKRAYHENLSLLIPLLYPIRGHLIYSETLNPAEEAPFRNMVGITRVMLELFNIEPDVIGLKYDGDKEPLPYPEAHFDISTIWFVIHKEWPSSCLDGAKHSFSYATLLERDTTLVPYWTRRVEYANRGVVRDR